MLELIVLTPRIQHLQPHFNQIENTTQTICAKGISDIFDYCTSNNISPTSIVLLSNDTVMLEKALDNNICSIGYFDYNTPPFSLPYIISSTDGLSINYFNRILTRFHNRPFVISSFKGFTVRECIDDDFDELYSMYSQEEDTSFVCSLYMKEDYNLEKEKFIRYIDFQYKFFDYGLYVIISPDNIICGQCGLYNDDEGRLCISYYIKSDYRRHHLAYECCNKIIEYAFNELDSNSIYAHLEDNNHPSKNLVYKLGFKHTDSDTYILSK